MPVVTRSQSKRANVVSNPTSTNMAEYKKVKDEFVCYQKQISALNRLDQYVGTINGELINITNSADLKMWSSTMIFRSLNQNIEYFFNCKKSRWFRIVSLAYNKCMDFQKQIKNPPIKYNSSILFNFLTELSKTIVILGKIIGDNYDDFEKYGKYQERLFLERSRDSGNEDESGNDISYQICKMMTHFKNNKNARNLRSV